MYEYNTVASMCICLLFCHATLCHQFCFSRHAWKNSMLGNDETSFIKTKYDGAIILNKY